MKRVYKILPVLGLLMLGLSLDVEAQNVGVGTATPGAKLMVVGDAGSPALNILNDGTTPMNPALRVNDNGRVGIGTVIPGARFMVIGTDGAPTMNILNDGNDPTNPALRINEDGNVGFGTTAPKSRIEVSEGDVYINLSLIHI